MIVTNQYVLISSNSASPSYIFNPFTVGSSWSNSYNVILHGNAVFNMVSTVASTEAGLTYSNFTAGYGFTMTNQDAIAGSTPLVVPVTVYPNQVVGFYGTAGAVMVTNYLSYP